ncbi:MAG: GH3 auxin-responsive promoter family protein [Planctomycetota bacterium]
MSTTPLKLARKGFRRYKIRKLNRFIADSRHARTVQRVNLGHHLRSIRSTAFAKHFGLQSIGGVDDFRSIMPVTDYEDHRPFIDRVIEGDTSALFSRGTRILMYANTSGTTAQPKNLPVTETFYRQYKASWQLWGTGVYRDNPELLGLKTLQFSSDWRCTMVGSGTTERPCGNISGLAAETRPFYLSSLFVLPASVIRIRDYAAKHYTALRLSMADPDVGMIITANPSTLISVAQRANEFREDLIRDIHNGTLSMHVDVPSEIRMDLRGKLRPNPGRARQLDRIVDRTGFLYPKDVWRQLRMLAVWTGGSVGQYVSELPQYYGETAIRDHGISASEGRMTIPLDDDCPHGILDYQSHYYEFIPADEHDHDRPTILEADELTPGCDYFILLTTSGGLCRYDIHDMVRCHGYCGEAPLLSFLNKGKNFSNMTGEKLSESQVIDAMKSVREETGIGMSTYTLAPRWEASDSSEGPSGYRLLLEDKESLHDTRVLAESLQAALCRVNCEYHDKCQSGRLQPVQVMRLPPGTWQAFRASKSSVRGNFEEFKHPCLTGDLEFIERMLSLQPMDSTLQSV